MNKVIRWREQASSTRTMSVSVINAICGHELSEVTVVRNLFLRGLCKWLRTVEMLGGLLQMLSTTVGEAENEALCDFEESNATTIARPDYSVVNYLDR